MRTHNRHETLEDQSSRVTSTNVCSELYRDTLRNLQSSFKNLLFKSAAEKAIKPDLSLDAHTLGALRPCTTEYALPIPDKVTCLCPTKAFINSNT